MSRDRVAQRLYMREYRSGKAGEALTGVTTAVTLAGDTTYSVTAAVEAEIDALGDHGTSRPGLAAAALKLAELLDNPTATPQYPAAAGRLRDLLTELRSGQPVVKETSLSRLRSDLISRKDQRSA